jgi:hypothetical protein
LSRSSSRSSSKAIGTNTGLEIEKAAIEAAKDHRSDLFSLGSVLYFMATGHPPFRADRPMAVLKRTCHDPHRPAWQCNAGIPGELSAIIDRLLAKSPSQRFASAEELQHKLAAVLSDVQQGRLNAVRRTSARRRIWLGAAGVLAAIALAVAMKGWLPWLGTSADPREVIPLAGQGPAESEANSSPSPLDDLMTTDPSPAPQSQGELETLSRMLDALEVTPFPETQTKE